MLKQGIDTIVMGCTHYPFVIPQIQKITRDAIQIIDPSPAIARQTRRILLSRNISTDGNPTACIRILTTGDAKKLARLLPVFMGISLPIEQLRWIADQSLILED